MLNFTHHHSIFQDERTIYCLIAMIIIFLFDLLKFFMLLSSMIYSLFRKVRFQQAYKFLKIATYYVVEHWVGNESVQTIQQSK